MSREIGGRGEGGAGTSGEALTEINAPLATVY
jgi:hypothetical protein